MTLDHFIQELEKTPRQWHVESDGAIRLIRDCPLSAVAGTPACAIMAANTALELSGGTADAIASAADSDKCLNQPLRLRLLRACGLA